MQQPQLRCLHSTRHASSISHRTLMLHNHCTGCIMKCPKQQPSAKAPASCTTAHSCSGKLTELQCRVCTDHLCRCLQLIHTKTSAKQEQAGFTSSKNINSRTCRTGLEGQQLAAYNSTARPADLAMLRCCPALFSSAARLLTNTSLALQEVMQHRQLCTVNSSQTPDQAQKHPASPSTELPHPQRFFTLFSHTPRPQTPLEAHGVTLHRIAKGKPQLTATAFLQQCTQLAAHSSQHTALSAQVTATAFQHCTRSKPHRQQPPCCGKTNCKTHIHTSALPLPALQHA